jgi:alginate O-acetyltransferase complex protein AlgI
MTLSRWLRDYLYVPLGGNRVGAARRYANLLIVMTLGGLWHGAADTFVVWGALHGGALAAERALGFHRLHERGGTVARVAWWLVVQATVLIAWVFFRSPGVASATTLLGHIVHGPYRPLDAAIPLAALALALSVPIAGHVRTVLEERFGLPGLSPSAKAIWGAVMAYAACTAYGPSKTFIYFQF